MTAPKPALFTPGLVKAVAIGLAVLLMLALNVVPMANNDLWILMKVGELIVDTGHIPQTLLFPFTTVQENHFNAHEWLVSVVFHEFDHLLGLKSLMWIMGAFALVQFGLCVQLARRQSGSLGAALLLATLAMICANYRYVMRPELFALLFLVCLLSVLDRYRSGRRASTLSWTIPIAALWANCHGSFLLAPVVAGLFAIGEAWTAANAASGALPARARAGVRAGLPYAVAALAITAACGLNPVGWHLLAFPFQLQQSNVIRMLIKEWLPTFSPLFMVERAFWVFVVIGVAACGVIYRLRRHLSATDLLLFACFSALALERQRHIVWFGFVAMTVCARLIGRLRIEARREIQLQGASAALSLVAFVSCMLFGNVVGSRVYFAPSNNFNPLLVRELADPKVAGNVFNSYELGGELIYRDWPRLKPSIDSRVDSYSDEYLLFSIRLLSDEKLLDLFLEGNRVSYMLLLSRDFNAGVRTMPSIRANWHVRWTDGDIFLLERNVALPPAASSG